MKKRFVYILLAFVCVFAAGCSKTPAQPSAATYTVYYETGSADAVISATSQTVTYGEKFTLLVPERDGFVFCGWTEKETGAEFYDGVYDRNDNVTLVAVWKQAVKITLNVGNDVTIDAKEVFVYDGGSYELPTPGKDGHSFVTWMKDDATVVSLTGTFRGTADVTYTAVWKRNDNVPMYAIKYDLGDTDAEISATETRADFGAAYTLLRPTRNGYAFAGWLIKGTQTTFADGTYALGWDVTLEATWEADDWTEIL